VLAASGWCGAGVLAWRVRARPDPKIVVVPGEMPVLSAVAFGDAVPAALVLLDLHGVVRHANREAVAQFGDTLGALMRHPAAQRALRGLPGGAVVQAMLVLDVPVRRVVQVAFRALEPEALPWAEGGVIAVLADRTEVDAVDRMRTDFVAHASHELRTPLASLVGFIDTLRGPAADDPEAQRQFLGIMAGQAGRMQRLIDRLLMLSKVQRLEHHRPKAVVDAGVVLDRVMDETAMMLRGRPVMLDLCPVEEEMPFRGDEDQIVQVLVNLIENAVKYAHGPGARPRREGLVTVSVLARVAGAEEDRWPERSGVVFSVSDDGAGIAEQHLPRLTERFYRVGGKVDGEVPSGSGLGLSIVKHIVDRHGGRLLIESEEGVGTTCLVWVPGV